MAKARDIIAQQVTLAQSESFFTDELGFISAKAYGAAGDGVTDDSTSLNAAINAATTSGAEVVWLVAGKTYYNTGLTDSTRITFVGDNASFTGSTYPIKQLANMIDILSASTITSTNLAPDIQVGSISALNLSGDSSSITAAINDMEIARIYGVRW